MVIVTACLKAAGLQLPGLPDAPLTLLLTFSLHGKTPPFFGGGGLPKPGKTGRQNELHIDKLLAKLGQSERKSVNKRPRDDLFAKTVGRSLWHLLDSGAVLQEPLQIC